MNQLVELAQERGIKLIVDLVYDSFTFDDVHPPSPLLYSDSWHHLYIVNSMSKNFGAPGLRIGWIISDDANIQTLAGLLERECIAVGGSAQEQAAHLIRLGNQPLVEQVQAGRLAVEQMLQAIPALRFRRPAGGTQFFVELPIEDVEAFADFMLLEYGLVLATTSNYAGLSGAFVRIPMGRQLETVHRALALLSAGLNSLT
jgi:beta-methylarginine biosynthesis bifunctional aminotransferase